MDIQHILRQIAAGNRQAFALLVERYQRPLFAYLGRMGLTQAQAEEIAQDAFLRAWQNLAQFDPKRAEFSTWLYTIARRLALNLLQSAPHRLETGTDETDDASMVSSSSNPLDHLEQAEQRQRLQKALRRLPLAERSILALAYIQGLDMKTIAHIEACSEGAAKVRLHRAREQLRQWLGG